MEVNKKLIVVFLLVAVFGTGYFYKDEITDYVFGFSQIKKPIDDFFYDVEDVAREVFTPPPLRVENNEDGSLLSRGGIFRWTNVQREENGLDSLLENTQLNYAAVEKLNDMFNGQYFAHVSPDELGVNHWVSRAGYEYLVVGENLALGNFDGDEDLVQAWMDSPGHRENILNEKYTEIGIAAGEGIFEGEETWLAVQVFGRPSSDCPQPSTQLKYKIEAYETNISSTERSITLLKKEIESISPKGRVFKSDYNKLVNEYNALVSTYNGLIGEVEEMIKDYNDEARAFNRCVSNL